MTKTTILEYLIFIGSMLLITVSSLVGARSFLTKLSSILSVVLGSVLLVTLLLHAVPGDPIDAILGEQTTIESKTQMAKDLGLLDENGNKKSLISQYSHFIIGITQNKIVSFRSREPVLQPIMTRLPYTLWLALTSVVFALCIGPLLGVLSAFLKKRLPWMDAGMLFVSTLFVCIPRFALAPILILIFAIWLRLFPISGTEAGWLSILLPSLSLGIALIAAQFRFTRASVLDVLKEDYIRTARAKGLSEPALLFKHALANALIPLITVVGLELGSLLSGAVVVEKIFNWPGIGLLLLESIQKRDMPVVQSTVICIAFFYTSMSFLTDVLYQHMNPRIQMEDN